MHRLTWTVAACLFSSTAAVTAGVGEEKMLRIQLSENGGDRATAYVMSNKILLLPEGFVCTWIDARRQNRWALVNRVNGEVLRRGTIGQPRVDNHCGAALVAHGEAVHAIIGAHHGPFEHFVLEDAKRGAWRHEATVAIKGSYPALVCDTKGRLHLAYRTNGKRWKLDYCGYVDGKWTAPRTLIIAEKRGYIYWTNGMTVDGAGNVHIVFGNTRVLEDDALHYSASHIFSRDGGKTWYDYASDRPLTLPAGLRDVSLMTAERDPTLILTQETQRRYSKPGPRNIEYRQILLSNPVVDSKEQVHVVLHNCQNGTASLMSRVDKTWRELPLTPFASNSVPSNRIHPQSSLSIGPRDMLHVALMVEPTKECVWGAPGTSIVHLQMQANESRIISRSVAQPDPSNAQWLPALEHPNTKPLDHVPALLYTMGNNAGGFANNKNEMKTTVFLEMTPTGLSRGQNQAEQEIEPDK